MHSAAAVGTAGDRVFGPTDERETRPLGAGTPSSPPAWCRPCMLRECPLDHRCMRGIAAPRSSRRRAGRYEARGVSRSRRHDDRGRRLPGRVERPRRFSVDGRRDARARRAGFTVVVVTNQSGVARGLLTERRSSTRSMRPCRGVLEAGARRCDAYYYCPHHPDGHGGGVYEALRLSQAGRRAGGRGGARSRSRPDAIVRGRRQVARRRRLARAVGAQGRPGPHRIRRQSEETPAPDLARRRRRGQPGGGRELDSENLRC